jgi:hypothetical protein
MAGLLCSTLHLLGLAANHYVSIAHPFRYSRIFTARHTTLLVLAMWTLPLVGLVRTCVDGYAQIGMFAMALLHPGHNYWSEKCLELNDYKSPEYRGILSTLMIVILVVICAFYAGVTVQLKQMRRRLDTNHSFVIFCVSCQHALQRQQNATFTSH